MTDVNTIPTSHAVCLLLPDILLMCRRRRAELLSTAIYIHSKPSQIVEVRYSDLTETSEQCWGVQITNNKKSKKKKKAESYFRSLAIIPSKILDYLR